MSIKQHFETALKSIQVERERAIAVAREKVTREKIIPHNQEVDKSMNDAIAEITRARDAAIAKVEEKYSLDREALLAEGARQKNDFAEKAIREEIAYIDSQYDDAIKFTIEQINRFVEE
jgi:hypothetical protein